MKSDAERKMQDGIEELENLRKIVRRWKESYSQLVAQTGSDESLCADFQEEIDTMVLPYLTRLVETEHISLSQVTEFLEFCSNEAKDLYDQIQQET